MKNLIKNKNMKILAVLILSLIISGMTILTITYKPVTIFVITAAIIALILAFFFSLVFIISWCINILSKEEEDENT